MAIVRVMYWKEIPVQVQAQDESGQISIPLDDRFQEGVDAISMFDGSSANDEYLMGWEWNKYSETEGNAEEAAATVAKSFNQGFPDNFVARIRDLHQSGLRNPDPGAIDHWISNDAD